MRYALSGSLAALSFSGAANALKVEQCASAVTYTEYVYVTAEPAAASGAAAAGGYGQGSKVVAGGAAEGGNGYAAEGSNGYAAEGGNGYTAEKGSHGYATADASTAAKPSVSPPCSDSTSSSSKPAVSTGTPAATGYGASYGGSVSSPAGSHTSAISIPEGSYAVGASSSSMLIETASSSAQGASSTSAPAATGYWGSYGVPFANSTSAAASYATGVSASAGISKSYATGVSSFVTSIIVAPSGVSSASAAESSTGASAVSSAISSASSAEALAVSSTASSSSASPTSSPPVSSPASTATQATPTGAYGPNVIKGGDFDDGTSSAWLYTPNVTLKNVGAEAQSGAYVLSATANKERYNAAHFSYDVGPLDWDAKYHLSFYHRLVTALPAGISCELSVGMGIAGLTDVTLTGADATTGWLHVDVADIVVTSAINTLSFDYYCSANAYFDNGGSAEFWLDTVSLTAQIPPPPTTTCTTSAPTGTPGPNFLGGGQIFNPGAGYHMIGWDYDSALTTVQDVGDAAHSPPYVLASTITPVLPSAAIRVDLQPPSLTAKYTLSFWVRFVASNMPAGSIPTLATFVGQTPVDRHVFSAADLANGWINIVVKDIGVQKFSDRVEFDFFDYGFPEKLVPGGELTWWLDDVQVWEQAPEIVTCA